MKKVLSKNNNKGFTLIELMMAASIMTVVFTLGSSVFINILNNYWQIKSISNTSQTGRYVMDTMSRDIRLAKSFIIDKNNKQFTLVDKNGNNINYTFSRNGGKGGIFVKNNSDSSQPITGQDYNISDYEISGVDFSQSTQIPYIEIEFTLVYSGPKSDKFGSTQTFKTAITSRQIPG